MMTIIVALILCLIINIILTYVDSRFSLGILWGIINAAILICGYQLESNETWSFYGSFMTALYAAFCIISIRCLTRREEVKEPQHYKHKCSNCGYKE